MLEAIALARIPKHAQPNPAIAPKNGTSSIPHAGASPNTIATSIGTQP